MNPIEKAVDLNQNNGPYANIFSIKQSDDLLDRVVSKQYGREIIINGKRLIDFASCNYLGMDLNSQVMASISQAMEEWGVHPSWSRIIASPVLYEELEAQLANLIGVEHALVIPTITLTHFGVLWAITGTGDKSLILVDKLAHKTVYDGALLATTSGAKMFSFSHNNINQVEGLLKDHSEKEIKIICVDGVYSLSGNYAPLKELQALAKKYEAIVYVDDAHGLGVVGERDGESTLPYGKRGNGIVRHLGLSYNNILYISGLSKAFSSLAAFVACPSLKVKNFFKSFATPYSHSGPIPVASLASAKKALEINDLEGEFLRDRLFEHCFRIRTAIDNIGLETTNNNYFPIISIWCGDSKNTKMASRLLFEKGILTTLGVYPYTPRNAGVIRISVTASHTYEQINRLLEVLIDLKTLLDKSK